MAVSMNSGSMRADFMISDAALPQRMAELLKDAEVQNGMFSQMLSDIGNAKGELALEVEEIVQKYSDIKDAGEMAIYRDKETGLPLPEDPKELATMILKGKVKLENVPSELITPELMKLLMLMKKADEFDKDGKDDEEDSDFDPSKAIAAEQAFHQSLSNSMLMELYQIIEKQNAGKDKAAAVDGIFGTVDAAQTITLTDGTEQEPAIGEDIFTEMIDNLVATVKEEQEFVEELAEAVPNVDMFVPSDKADVPEVIPQGAEAVQTVQNLQTETVAETTTGQSAVIQTAVSQNEQTAQTAAQQNVPVEEFTVKTVKTEKPEIAENAVRQQETVEPIEVKAVTRNENAQQLDKTAEQDPMRTVEPVSEKAVGQVPEKIAEQAPEKMIDQASEKAVERASEKAGISENTVEQTDKASEFKTVNAANAAEQPTEKPAEIPRTAENRPERVKSATEEFEMLRNAKIKTDPAEEESGRTAQPLNADSPIVFKREDGSEIEVRPGEIIEQTAKLVQRAVSENDDKTEYSMVLNPEDLGKITVKLTKAADGAVSVTIAAENARTQRIIEQHSDLMQSNLRSNGVNLESWQTVNERQQENTAQDYNGSSKNPYYRNDHRNAEDNSDGDMSFAELIASM